MCRSGSLGNIHSHGEESLSSCAGKSSVCFWRDLLTAAHLVCAATVASKGHVDVSRRETKGCNSCQQWPPFLLLQLATCDGGISKLRSSWSPASLVLLSGLSLVFPLCQGALTSSVPSWGFLSASSVGGKAIPSMPAAGQDHQQPLRGSWWPSSFSSFLFLFSSLKFMHT